MHGAGGAADDAARVGDEQVLHAAGDAGVADRHRAEREEFALHRTRDRDAVELIIRSGRQGLDSQVGGRVKLVHAAAVNRAGRHRSLAAQQLGECVVDLPALRDLGVNVLDLHRLRAVGKTEGETVAVLGDAAGHLDFKAVAVADGGGNGLRLDAGAAAAGQRRRGVARCHHVQAVAAGRAVGNDGNTGLRAAKSKAVAIGAAAADRDVAAAKQRLQSRAQL